MRARAVFLGLTLIAALANVAALIMIMAALDRRGRKTNMFMARLFTGRYLSAYKETTKKETGKPGPLYSLWIVAIILALVFAVIAVLLPQE
ncbi:MAG TPA: hypothetical protein PK207_09730 [Candidatus Aminicenantes bacterium]|jgi:hypothetical protein|nr:hypothetical protein [Acidobacteriota bacterium]HPL14472.1 hypothetical protein [Candidatus Aminicenantes bacterium]